ncbi:hypothetical protein [Kitasatospora sp. NPDC088783]|uniref:hypothetical protein n=1 Tax=Kitasatospora sp. NPDC088783 TaxID=3364077 RepID=UPI00382D8144
MTARMPDPRTHIGARVRVGAGHARLLPAPATALEGAVECEFSVLSPGTERRHLAGPNREAGYMALGRTRGAWVLAPVPHGAAFHPGHPGAVHAPPGTGLREAALARFQMMALLGLDRLPGTGLDGAVVVGSGPVALGCALELARRGARGVRVATERRHAPIGTVPGVEVVAPGQARPARLVLDAAGDVVRAAALVAPGGVLGLLGTPEENTELGAAQVHRAGWTVVGMHELANRDAAAYQDAYRVAAAYLSERVDGALPAAWCRIVPGERAVELYGLLGAPSRPAEPVLILDWRPQ